MSLHETVLAYRQLALATPCLVVALAASAIAQHSSSSPTSAHVKAVILPSISAEAMVGIRLDRDIYFNSTQRFADLRVLNDFEQEVPFVLRKLVTDIRSTKRARSTVFQPQVRPLENGDVEIQFNLDPTEYFLPVHGFRLVTNLVNFEHRVSVERQEAGSNSWNVLVSEAVIYDYSQFMDVKSTDISLPKESATVAGGKFRMRINQATQERQSQWKELTTSMKAGNETGREEKFLVNRQPFRIERIECWHETEVIESSQLQLEDYGLKVLSIEQDEKTKSTLVDLESHNEPLTEMSLVTNDSNFCRSVEVLAPTSNDQTAGSLSQERVLATSKLLRISLGNVQQEHLWIGLPETRGTNYRLAIRNQDSPALASLSFTARGPIYEVVFLANPDRSYRLTYGNSLLESPHYDTAALQSALAAKSVPEAATLGEQRTFQVTDTRPVGIQWLSNPWLVGGVILGLLVLLGAVLRQAAQRLDHIPRS